MSHLIYLFSLLLSLAGLGLIDHRLKLAFFNDAKRTLSAIVPALVIFVLWDIAGIALGIFSHGESKFSLPFTVFPEFPLEEFFFLFLLCYVTLLLYLGAKRVWPRI